MSPSVVYLRVISLSRVQQRIISPFLEVLSMLSTFLEQKFDNNDSAANSGAGLLH
jgi:hypothetical protein